MYEVCEYLADFLTFFKIYPKIFYINIDDSERSKFILQVFNNLYSTSQYTHSASVTKTSQLMLYWK
jgi:hypothetical protein